MFCLDIFYQLGGFYENNYLSSPNGLSVNSPFGLRAQGIIVNYPCNELKPGLTGKSRIGDQGSGVRDR